jgi:hypothetical protein
MNGNAVPSLNSIEVQVILHEIIKSALAYGNTGLELAKIKTLGTLAEELSQIDAQLGQALGEAASKLLEIGEQSVQRHLARGEGILELVFGVRPAVAEHRARDHILQLHRGLVDSCLRYTEVLMTRKLQMFQMLAAMEEKGEQNVQQMLQHLLPNLSTTAALPEGEIRVEGLKTTPLPKLHIVNDD